jgi:hypothetical protein
MLGWPDVRFRAVIWIAACLAIAVAAPAFASSPTIAGKTAVATLRAENAAFNASDWKALWTAYTANDKAHCGPYAKWAKQEAATRKQIGGNVTTRITGNKVVGAKAFLAYQILSGTTVVFTVKASSPDVYVRINGLWYDEYEPAHGC